MDINKNTYTFQFAGIMVVVVAALLSAAAISLKPFQDRNVELEKKQNILASVGITVERDSAEKVYADNIKKEVLLDANGNEIEGSAFDVDLAKELKKDREDQQFPLFINEADGTTRYIIPLRGKGLWGPIWGYLALEEDLNTVYGAVFDHKTETPGLGAEINKESFQEPFKGKTIFEGSELVSIKVAKGGTTAQDYHKVDAISGGTVTSDGVTDMLKERLGNYLTYFEKLKAAAPAAETAPAAAPETEETNTDSTQTIN